VATGLAIALALLAARPSAQLPTPPPPTNHSQVSPGRRLSRERAHSGRSGRLFRCHRQNATTAWTGSSGQNAGIAV